MLIKITTIKGLNLNALESKKSNLGRLQVMSFASFNVKAGSRMLSDFSTRSVWFCVTAIYVLGQGSSSFEKIMRYRVAMFSWKNHEQSHLQLNLKEL